MHAILKAVAGALIYCHLSRLFCRFLLLVLLLMTKMFQEIEGLLVLASRRLKITNLQILLYASTFLKSSSINLFSLLLRFFHVVWFSNMGNGNWVHLLSICFDSDSRSCLSILFYCISVSEVCVFCFPVGFAVQIFGILDCKMFK